MPDLGRSQPDSRRDLTRSNEISAKFGEFSPKKKKLIGFSTIDDPTKTDRFLMPIRPLRSDSLASRLRVWTFTTRFCQVNHGLGTNLTRTNLWTPLN